VKAQRAGLQQKRINISRNANSHQRQWSSDEILAGISNVCPTSLWLQCRAEYLHLRALDPFVKATLTGGGKLCILKGMSPFFPPPAEEKKNTNFNK